DNTEEHYKKFRVIRSPAPNEYYLRKQVKIETPEISTTIQQDCWKLSKKDVFEHKFKLMY
ncbi:unnamed protein product, partial [Arctia plantaginis]